MHMFEDLFALPRTDDEGEFMPLFTVEEDMDNIENEDSPDSLPILALKNTVLFPGIIIPITIGRDKSIKAVNAAYGDNKVLGVLSQKDPEVENPSPKDLYEIGTVARIVKLLKMPDGTATAILQGRNRFKVERVSQEDPFMAGDVQHLEELSVPEGLEFKAMISSIRDKAYQIIEMSPNIPSEASVMLKNINQDGFLINFIASNLGVKLQAKQEILEIGELKNKAQTVLEYIDNELRLLEIKDQIETKVRGDIEKQQRDYYLNQQLKTIQEELGQDPQSEEIAKLAQRALDKNWSQPVGEAFQKELKKLGRINPQVAEYSVQLNYLELMLDLPWEDYTEDNFDLNKVKKILDEAHYGLEDVKVRILEHLAVLKLKGDMKAPILCLVGPPGVGKTSLGKSIAEALDRKFVRMSLGGLHDESEIRGHRKTYIGAMPGRILQSLKKAESSNPVFILDEIDKVGKDFRGDPSSALLEVLDPEQNEHFHDNYLEIDYDLSKIMFVATANSLATIQPALRDRMEIIQVSGYSIEEKTEIAVRHLVPRQRKLHGLEGKHVKLKKEVISRIIKDYTRESGVRNLDRQMARVMRYVAKNVAMEQEYNPNIRIQDLTTILGPVKYSTDIYNEKLTPGVAVGLAWTQVGGDILFIETSLSPGKGKLILTGNLGDVMKESATTALSYIKANQQKLGVSKSDLEEHDIHIHVPEGAIPKDGPSAGITMLSALVSAFIKKPLRSRLAMTGEITLRGKVLPVGGIKEKVLAAKRAGIKDIILCHENEKHVDEIQSDFIKGLNFNYVKTMEEVLKFAIK